MTVSESLANLSQRAKKAEDKAAAARSQAKADFDRTLKESRDAAQRHADAMRANVEDTESMVSEWWQGVQSSWSEHVAAMHKNIEQKRAKRGATRAEIQAEDAETDALLAIDYAYAAIEEAEYAVLDAVRARIDADEAAQKSGAPA